MAGRDQKIEHPSDKTPRDFLLAEYQALVQLDGARNDRLDRYLTLFLTLAGAPWALYILILKPPASTVDFAAVPLPVACVFLGTGLLGGLLTMMFVQVGFTIILYMRAMNRIRGYFSKAGDIGDALRLPTRGNVPPYLEKGGYRQWAVFGMGVVDSIYVALGFYFLWPRPRWIWIGSSVVLGLCWFLFHLIYYSRQANGREKRDRGRGELEFRSSSGPL